MAGKRVGRRRRLNPRFVIFMLLVLLVLLVIGGAVALALRGRGEASPDETVPPTDPDTIGPSQDPADKLWEMDYSLRIEEGDDTLTSGQKKLLGDFMTAWYQDVGTLNGEPSYDRFFEKDEDDDAWRHEAALRTLTAIRRRGLEDLRLERCDTTLTITGIEPQGDERLRITLSEDSVMRFAGLTVDSYLYDMPHVFYMKETGADTWILTYHEAEDNPFLSYTYEAGNPYDKNHDLILAAIDARHAALNDDAAPVTKDCDHPYDRTAAEAYMRAYSDRRNPSWYVYDDVGGNCMNFGSQVLLAGGIPMEDTGAAEWYWYNVNNVTLSFINVGRFYDYARDNTGHGLVAAVDAPYRSGEVGDILIFGFEGDLRHTTVISGMVTDENGGFLDYLLCSNTTNYRDFPAGAYYYTEHTLVKIFGYNE